MPALPIAAIAAVATIAGTGYSIYSGQQAASASKKAERARQQQFRLQQEADRRKAIRDFQLRRATTLSNIQGATGTVENSAAGGALSAYSSTIGTQLGEFARSGEIGDNLFSANADYSQASANAQAGQQIAGLGKDLFGSQPTITNVGQSLFG